MRLGTVHILAFGTHLAQRTSPNFAIQEMAFETTQKYKEGKFIIEKARVVKVSGPLVQCLAAHLAFLAQCLISMRKMCFQPYRMCSRARKL